MVDSKFDVVVGNDEVPEIDTVDNLWTEKLESYFVYLMVEEISKGTMQATTFANAAWQRFAESLRRATGKEYTYYQLKNKYHNLRTRWSDFTSMLIEKDVHFNLVTGEVTATEDVWRRLYSKCRRAKSFRKKGLKDYDKLCVIFGDPEMQFLNNNVRSKDKISNDFTEGQADTPRVKRSEKCYALKASSNATIRDKANKRQKLEKKTSFTASLDSVADSGDGHGYEFAQVQDVVRCMEALNQLEGIDGASYVKATRFIHDDALWRKMFLCMPDERKKDWVLNI
ncbi:hypothetical protein RND81_10G129900 [Saponaria officinalis]|uniref:Myb/SANT-like domain-containing protein n=1 Tax=Saponaria officinalis TaxID=3572 RepID=A0AAW1I1R7_SAPOF